MHYAQAKGPPWLDRSWVEDQVRHHGQVHEYQPSLHKNVFPCVLALQRSSLVDARMAAIRSTTKDDLDDLVKAAPSGVLTWMRRKAMLADGTAPGLPVATPKDVQSAVRAVDWTASPRPGAGKRGPPGPGVSEIAAVGMLRDASGLTLAQTARFLDRTVARVVTARREYVRRMLNEEPFANMAAAALAAAVRASTNMASTAHIGAWHRTAE
jgi:hypothetical protein